MLRLFRNHRITCSSSGLRRVASTGTAVRAGTRGLEGMQDTGREDPVGAGRGRGEPSGEDPGKVLVAEVPIGGVLLGTFRGEVRGADRDEAHGVVRGVVRGEVRGADRDVVHHGEVHGVVHFATFQNCVGSGRGIACHSVRLSFHSDRLSFHNRDRKETESFVRQGMTTTPCER